MTPEEARQLIGLEGKFTNEELEAAFCRRSQELESKIERAPTAGLKEKYRRNLDQLEEAWEVLSDSGSTRAPDNFPSLQPVISPIPVASPAPLTPSEPALEKVEPSSNKRPALVWVISSFWVLGASVGLVALFLRLGQPGLDQPMLTVFEFVGCIVGGTGGILLFLFRRVAFRFFLAYMLVSLLTKVYVLVYLELHDDSSLAQVRISASIAGVVIGLAIYILILRYIASLSRKGILH
jgi:hypothetical protein